FAQSRGRRSTEHRAREDDRTRIFHTTKASRTDDQRQLLVRIRRDRLRKKLKRRISRRETFQRDRAVRVRHVVGQWRNYRRRWCEPRKLAHNDYHAIRRNRNAFREGPCALTVSIRFDVIQAAVSDHFLA